MRRKKVGLALGAGAFRGLAHIGVLDVFVEEQIPIDMIAGTSMGSLIGAAFVTGKQPKEMEALLNDFKERQLFDVVVPRQGVLGGKRVQTLIQELTQDGTFSDTIIPFAAVACDFETMEQVVLREGPLHEAVRASISIPGVFVPVELNDRLLVDGGLIDRVPADVCREMGADIVIGVDVGYRGQPLRTQNIVEHVMHAIDIMEWQIAQLRLSHADILIAPDVLDFNPARIGSRGAECVERGRAAARAALPEIRALLEQPGDDCDGDAQGAR